MTSSTAIDLTCTWFSSSRIILQSATTCTNWDQSWPPCADAATPLWLGERGLMGRRLGMDEGGSDGGCCTAAVRNDAGPPVRVGCRSDCMAKFSISIPAASGKLEPSSRFARPDAPPGAAQLSSSRQPKSCSSRESDGGRGGGPDTKMVRETSKPSREGFAVGGGVSFVEPREGGLKDLVRDASEGGCSCWLSGGNGCTPPLDPASDVLRCRLGVLPTMDTTYSQRRLRVLHLWQPLLSPLHRI